jgi:RNA polymerase sigma-54 factor
MTMRLDMGFGQHMDMRPSPSLIQFTEILALTSLELQSLIAQEAAENPALEVAESANCPACGDPLLADGSCYRCRRGEDLAGLAARDLVEGEDEDEPFDVLAVVPDQRSLAEHLLDELAMVLDPSDLPIAEFLVGELDERGFLGSSVDMAAASLGVSVARVEQVLTMLQLVGPLGLGARSVEECLALQLARWEAAGLAHPLARPLVTEHLDDLAAGRYSQLARQLGATNEDVIAARDFIRSHLRPYPIAERIDLAPWERVRGTGFVAPDVVVRSTDDGFDVEVVESRRYVVSISPLYRDLATALEAGRQADAHAGLSGKDREHVRLQVQRARQFMQHIRERRDTVRRVAAYVMARQSEFLRHGPRQMVPLTRAEVAEALDLHESTVSRATAGKYVLLPSRQVVPFAAFFKAATSVQDVLRELVAQEDRPLTDTELAELLAEQGYDVARRTVAKYRNQLGILPSSLR